MTKVIVGMTISLDGISATDTAVRALIVELTGRVQANKQVWKGDNQW